MNDSMLTIYIEFLFLVISFVPVNDYVSVYAYVCACAVRTRMWLLSLPDRLVLFCNNSAHNMKHTHQAN